LHELLDPRTGRLYEIDLLVLRPNGLYLIEIKSQPGLLTGNFQDGTFTDASGKLRQNLGPYGATNHMANVLASLLKSELRQSLLWAMGACHPTSPLERVLCARLNPDGSAKVISAASHPRLAEWQGGFDLGTPFASWTEFYKSANISADHHIPLNRPKNPG